MVRIRQGGSCCRPAELGECALAEGSILTSVFCFTEPGPANCRRSMRAYGSFAKPKLGRCPQLRLWHSKPRARPHLAENERLYLNSKGVQASAWGTESQPGHGV